MTTGLELFLEMLKIPSPAGWEDAFDDWLRRFVSELLGRSSVEWSLRRDVCGNLLVVVGNDEEAPSVMLSAHKDEVGFMVTKVDDDGLVCIRPLGGLPPAVMPGARVLLFPLGVRRRIAEVEPVPGVVGYNRYESTADPAKVPSFEELRVDIGALDRKEASRLVSPGDPGLIAADPLRLAGDRIAARGIDDKVGCLVILSVLERLFRGERPAGFLPRLVLAFTSREEIGCVGASTVRQSCGVDVEFVVNIDVTYDTAMRGMKDALWGGASIGGGPVVARGPHVDAELTAVLIESAETAGIEVQHETAVSFGSDADKIAVSGEGTRAAGVFIPLRYMHSGAEVVSMSDVEDAAVLIAGALLGLEKVGMSG